MQSTRSRADRVLQAIKGALFGGGGPADSFTSENQAASIEPVSSSLHSEARFQAVHDQGRSEETSELDGRTGYINVGTMSEPKWVEPTLLTPGRPTSFGHDYNNQYYADYFHDDNLLTLSVNGTDHFYLSIEEAKALRNILDEFIELEEHE